MYGRVSAQRVMAITIRGASVLGLTIRGHPTTLFFYKFFLLTQVSLL